MSNSNPNYGIERQEQVSIVASTPVNESKILQNASAGLALKGIFISTNDEEILRPRFNLIKVKDDIYLTNSSHTTFDKTEEFKSQNKENIFKKRIENFGASTQASLEANGLFKGLLSASASFSSNKEGQYSVETNNKSESRYYSKVQYVVVPTAACILNPNQIRLDNNALQELKRIDNILRNPDSENIAIQACKDFLKNYGSHALLGTVTLGGIYLISASCSEFSSSEEQKIINVVSKKITNQFNIGFAKVVGANVNTNNSSSTDNQDVYEQERLESKIQLEKIKIGGLPQADDIKSWQDGLLQNHSTWAVIDREQKGTFAVWEIICRYYVNEFDNCQQIAKMLHSEWTKLSGLKTEFQYFDDRIAQVNDKINSITNQIDSWISEQKFTADGLKRLVDLRKEIERETEDNRYWAQKVLSVNKVQEYLQGVKDNGIDSQEIKNLIRRLLTPEDAIAMFNEDYSQLKKIFDWLNQQNETTNILDDVSDINTLIDKILKYKLDINLDINTDTRKSRQKQVTQNLQLAIISLRFSLQKQDKLSELYLLSLLFTLGYMPDLNIFNRVLEIEDYNKLEDLLKKYKESCLGIEAKKYNLDKREAREASLVLQVLTSDIFPLEKERVIDFIDNTLQPKLVSSSVLSILKRYNIGLSFDLVDAVRELNNIIDDVPNNQQSGISLQDIVIVEEEDKLSSTTDAVVSNEQFSSKLQDTLERLGLTKYYPEKLGREEVYSITEYSLEQNTPATTEQLAEHFWTNLISFNYEARQLKIAKSGQTLPKSRFGKDNSQAKVTSDVHPLDVVVTTFLCCNPIIRQDLVQKLWGCKLAIPLVIQESENKSPKLFLWTMRSLVMKWKTSQGEESISKEYEISNYPVETVSFIRFNHSEISKSSLLNWVISENETDKSHPIFFHRNSVGSTRNRQLSEGMVEIAWYLPKGVKEDNFQDITSFTNLRGDARKYPVQLKLIKQFACKIVILTSANELQEKEAEKIVKDFLEAGKYVIILLTDKTLTESDYNSVNNFLKQFSDYINQKLVILDVEEDKTHPEIRDDIRQTLKEMKASNNSKVSLEHLAQTIQQLGVDIDELEENCQQGIEKAKEILQIIQRHDKDKRKAELLPLQGELWGKWAEADKKVYRPDIIGEEKLNTYVERQEARKIESRKQQFEIVKNNLSQVMKLFLDNLLKENLSVREYFIRCLKLGLDELSRQELSLLYASYSEQMKQIHEAKTLEEKAVINERLAKLDQSISAQSFGLEHLLREMAQIYAALMTRPESERQEFSQLINRLPKIAADLLLNGYPVEIMDGDVSSVQVDWVQAVLKELNQILREKEKLENPRIFVLSALGIQSSGKSTLLNVMFGLQFAVSAGRCTRGVYLQPVKVENKLREKLNVDYIFVVDTEGLKSPELSSDSTRKHDNELSTFVIGLSNLALIKLPGENNTYLQEILPISVHAFLRMKEVKLNSKTKIVHRNVDKSSEDKLNTQSRILNENLDTYTKIACEFERTATRQFKDIIDFNLKDDVEYLPSLHEGDDIRNAVIPNYSKEAKIIKKKIINEKTLEPQSSIATFGEHLQSLWTAVKKDDFVYEFKNTIETQARGVLDKFWCEINQEFYKQVAELETNAYTRLMNCTTEKELFKISDEQNGNLSKEIDKIFDIQKEKLREFFKTSKGMYEDCMQQWENNTFARLRDLGDKLRNQANQKLESYQNSKQAELTVDKELLQYEKRIIDYIRLFVQQQNQKANQEDITSFSDTKLQQLFKQQWSNWMSDISSQYRNPMKPANVEARTEQALRDAYPQWWTSIKDKISKYQTIRNIDLNSFFVNESHYKWDTTQAAKKAIGKILKGSIPKGKEEEVLREIEQFKEKLFNYVDNALKEKEEKLQQYNESYIRDILQYIKSNLEELSNKLLENTSFYLTPDLEIDLVIAVCGHAIKRLENLDKRFRERQNPIIKLENEKEYYFTIFQANFKKVSIETTVTKVLLQIILEGIAEKIEVLLPDEISNKMQSITHAKVLNNKQSLLASVLISLAEKGDLNSFYTYIHNPEISIRDWVSRYFYEFNAKDRGVQGVIEEKIKKLVDVAEVFVEETNIYIESIQASSRSIETWTEKFRELANGHLIIKNLEKISAIDFNVDGFDFNYFKEKICKGLQEEKSPLTSKFLNSSNSNIGNKSFSIKFSSAIKQLFNLSDFSKQSKDTSLKDKVVDKLIASVIGCVKSCPFCGEICISGMDGHGGDHETPYHRPQGVTGYRPVYGEPKLVTTTCPQDVAVNSKFCNADTNWEFKPYKQYREVNDYYRSWKINPDLTLEASSYWKWFMATYSYQLAKLYDAAEPDIPESWKSLTKEQEIEKLRKLIEG